VLARAGTAPPAHATCWVQFDDWMRGTPDQAAAPMNPYAGAIEAWEVWKAASHVKLGVRRAGPDRLSLWGKRPRLSASYNEEDAHR
jgi:hypothetical protein